MKVKYFKQVLFLAVLTIIIGFIMQLMQYEKAYLLTSIGLFLGLLAYILAVKDLQNMKGIPSEERFYLAIILFFANIIGLILYVPLSKIWQARSDRNLKEREGRWDKLTKAK